MFLFSLLCFNSEGRPYNVEIKKRKMDKKMKICGKFQNCLKIFLMTKINSFIKILDIYFILNFIANPFQLSVIEKWLYQK